MGRRPAKFTQSDLTKAIKAAARAGVNMAVEISKDGTIRMVLEDKSASVPVAQHREIVL